MFAYYGLRHLDYRCRPHATQASHLSLPSSVHKTSSFLFLSFLFFSFLFFSFLFFSFLFFSFLFSSLRSSNYDMLHVNLHGLSSIIRNDCFSRINFFLRGELTLHKYSLFKYCHATAIASSPYFLVVDHIKKLAAFRRFFPRHHFYQQEVDEIVWYE